MTKEGCLYLRVSSKEQEEEGFSIPAQEKFLRKYAKQKGIVITEVFAESVSSKETGRVQFNKMLKYAKSKKKAYHILCEKNDRLLRNEDDAATIKNLFTKTECCVHLVKDNMILSRESTPHEIFVFMMFSALSSLYPRNLSIEVKKGMNEAAEEGYYPAKAPTGYLNSRHGKKSEIVIDPDTSFFVTRAFEQYATGIYSYRTLAKKLASEGFMIGKRKCSEKSLEKILKNPFYMGDFVYNGKRYFNCRHVPLISKELFLAVQKTIRNHTAPKNIKHDFLYSGLIKSPNGFSLAGDIKKKKYVYYRSTDVRDRGLKLLKEETIDKAVEDLLKGLEMPQEHVQKVLELVKGMLDANKSYDIQSMEELMKQIKVLKNRLNQLYLDKLDGDISPEFYLEKRNEWEVELDELRSQYEYVSKEKEELFARVETIFTLCKNAYSVYIQGDTMQKRLLLKLLSSHFLWNGEKLTITLKSTIKPLLNSANFQNGGLSASILTLLEEIKKPENIAFFEATKTFLQAA